MGKIINKNMGEYAAYWASQGAKELCPWVTSTKPLLLLFHFLSLRISQNIPPCISPRLSWKRLSTQGRKQECGFCKLEADTGRVVFFSYQIFHIRAFKGQNYCDDPSRVCWVYIKIRYTLTTTMFLEIINFYSLPLMLIFLQSMIVSYMSRTLAK